ncbi:hypothetical protein HW115_05210 [Verrucomicrobiaceae bacterium N1E253]|uniref:Chromosome segregation protein SMC n=1 Tax=Oceaniferula marina TaxID=2748318 RepID=A0A851GC46_9BACT|nr:SbcC/MukB-like Walker B domain-containing protein [Oceaniferula marina]NWK54996.1 hypothetical protein [Oceaniferula marina]
MSRAINLSKIHALNWYGYRDSLPVKGNLVLAGVTGSGKSILMDLLMLVLVGPERARHHFNRSATGGKSDRTIKSYCLLDTKREENGQPQYFHHKGITTYIAAEFTWPDGQRVETWGLRLEYRGVSEHEGNITPFFCPASLERDDFLRRSEHDGKQYPATMAEFKQLIDSHQGRLFSSSREYLRDMSNPSHLNFNQDVIQRLLPSAMSFTNLKSFDDFCRQFVLPSEGIPVEDVISSFRDFETYERELHDLRGQLERLLAIRTHATTLKQAQQDQEVARYLTSETAFAFAKDLFDHGQQHLDQLRKENEEDEQRLAEIGELLTEVQRRRDTCTALLNESEEGRFYKRLCDELEEMEKRLEQLRNISAKVDRDIGNRLQQAKQWAQEIAQAPCDPPVNTAEFLTEIKLLDGCKQEENANHLSLLAAAADKLCKKIRDSFRKEDEQLRQFRREQEELQRHISLLQQGLPPHPQPLLTALQSQLPVLPGETPPQAARELYEITDESWRAAAEMAFSQKFSVFVSSDHFEAASNILKSLPESEIQQSQGQELIDRGAITSKPGKSGKIKKNALAGLFSCDDPAARSYIDQHFGKLIRVQSSDELHQHDSAISIDGIIKCGATISRPPGYDGTPFIGESGLQRQLESKQSRLREIEAELRRLEPIETEVQRLITERNNKIPHHTELTRQLIRIEELPGLESKHAEGMAQLQAVSTDQLEQLEQEIHDLEAQAQALQSENTSILRKGGIGEIRRTEKELANYKEEYLRREQEFLKIQQAINIYPHQARYDEWKQDMAERFPALDVQRREFSKAAQAAEQSSSQSSAEITIAMADFKREYHPKFDDLPDTPHETDAYERILQSIENADIPSYEKKSKQERRRWESLFRTQVLSRMQQALNNVENIISLLNVQLKQPIGHDRYKIAKKANPDFKVYRELIDRNALHHEDELFFASMGEELKQALEDFLQILTRKGSNSPEAARLLDYRQYFDYDLLVTDIRDPKLKPVSVDKQSGKMSGGENQSPYFVAILASYLHAYKRHETRRKEPSLALVPIDEAFSKLSGERIQNCILAMAQLDLQGMFSMSSGNIPYAFSQCDELIVISRKEERRGKRIGVRNVPVVLFRDSKDGKDWMKANGLEK